MYVVSMANLILLKLLFVCLMWFHSKRASLLAPFFLPKIKKNLKKDYK